MARAASDYDLANAPRTENVYLNQPNERPARRRRSLRLQAYDYAQVGAYFVTISVHERLCLFGEVRDDQMRLSQAGRMAWRIWRQLPQRFPTIQTDAFIVMPNHVHGIILLNEHPQSDSDTGPDADQGADIPVGAPLVGAQDRDAPGMSRPPVGEPLVGAQRQNAPGTRRVPRATPTAGRITLGDVIGAYKSLTTVEYTRGVKTRNWPPFPGRLWHRNYYEHVVRNDESLTRLRRYILGNPTQWAIDRENPRAARPDSETT